MSRLEKHDFDGAFYAWVPDIADPDPYVLLHSSQADAGANYPGWKNADADKLLDEGRRATERAERKKAYFALHRLVADEQPYTFLYAPQTHFAWNRRVHAVNPIYVADLPRFPGVAKWWVEE